MIKNTLKILFLFSAFSLSYNASAYNGKPITEICQKPHFDKFSLPVYKVPERLEVTPESEFSFTVSSKVAAESIRIMMKKDTIKYTVESNNSFHKITSKIPAKFTGKFIRINVFAIAKLECKSTHGWLIKVSKAPATQAPDLKAISEVKVIPKIETQDVIADDLTY
ncbi:MAG: hypothetical protein KAG26_00935 [Methylococcales bacterium]|nr:hypothetical protein [Methylococcales bacterium]